MNLHKVESNQREKAYYITELPEDDFNDLACGHLSQFTHSRVMSTGSRQSALNSSDDHGDGEGCERLSSCSPVSSVPIPSPDLFAAPQFSDNLNSDPVPKFPMTLSSQFSRKISHTDSSDVEGTNAFDYLPQKEKICITRIYKPNHDEEVELKSDKSSVESPGSDVSSTHEYNFSGSESELNTERITSKTNENGEEQKLYQQTEAKPRQQAFGASPHFPTSESGLCNVPNSSIIRGDAPISQSKTNFMAMDQRDNPIDKNTDNRQNLKEPPKANDEGKRLASAKSTLYYGATFQNGSARGGVDHPDISAVPRSDDLNNLPNTSSAHLERRKGSRRVRKPEVTHFTHEDPNWVGDVKDVDNLVKFITTGISQKELKRLNQTSSSGAVGSALSGTALVATRSQNMKKKCKTKSTLNSVSGENPESLYTFSAETWSGSSVAVETSLTKSASDHASYDCVLVAQDGEEKTDERTDAGEGSKEMSNRSEKSGSKEISNRSEKSGKAKKLAKLSEPVIKDYLFAHNDILAVSVKPSPESITSCVCENHARTVLNVQSNASVAAEESKHKQSKRKREKKKLVVHFPTGQPNVNRQIKLQPLKNNNLSECVCDSFYSNTDQKPIVNVKEELRTNTKTDVTKTNSTQQKQNSDESHWPISDSSTESVKSFPEVHGTGECETILPLYCQSAEVTPLPKNDSSKPENGSSGSEGRASMGQLSYPPVVWKDNLNDRRHSIGSSSEVLSKASPTGVLTNARPKGGSQDALAHGAVNTSGIAKNRNAATPQSELGRRLEYTTTALPVQQSVNTPTTNEGKRLVSVNSTLYGATSQNDSATGKVDHHNISPMSRSDNLTNHPSTSSAHPERRKDSKRVRKPGVTQFTHEVPNWVGDVKDVDNLVKFITNGISQKELKKLNQRSGSGGNSGAISGTAIAITKSRTKGKITTQLPFPKHSTLFPPRENEHNAPITFLQETHCI